MIKAELAEIHVMESEVQFQTTEELIKHNELYQLIPIEDQV